MLRGAVVAIGRCADSPKRVYARALTPSSAHGARTATAWRGPCRGYTGICYAPLHPLSAVPALVASLPARLALRCDDGRPECELREVYLIYAGRGVPARTARTARRMLRNPSSSCAQVVLRRPSWWPAQSTFVDRKSVV